MFIDSLIVKKLRTDKNWSQEMLSEKSGLSLRTIQRVESGNNTSQETVRLLAAALEVDSKDLIKQQTKENKKPLESVMTALKEFSNFSGKATRSDYWWFILFLLLVMGLASIIHEKAYQIIGVLFIIPFISVGTRRLNDIGQSPWWQLLLLVPFGQIVVFYFMAQPGSDIKNAK